MKGHEYWGRAPLANRQDIGSSVPFGASTFWSKLTDQGVYKRGREREFSAFSVISWPAKGFRCDFWNRWRSLFAGEATGFDRETPLPVLSLRETLP